MLALFKSIDEHIKKYWLLKTFHIKDTSVSCIFTDGNVVLLTHSKSIVKHHSKVHKEKLKFTQIKMT